MQISEFTPILVAIIAGLFGQPIMQLINTFSRRKLKKIKNADEAFSLFEKFETDFNKNFILPDLKETYFYIQTGIKTNESSIEKYIEFKNSLGGNYTWNHIKIAKPHLEVGEQGINVRLRKFERVFSDFVLIISLILFFVGIIGFIYLNQLETKNLKEVFLPIFVLFIPMFTGYLFVNGINSIIVAKGIEKKITKLNNNSA